MSGSDDERDDMLHEKQVKAMLMYVHGRPQKEREKVDVLKIRHRVERLQDSLGLDQRFWRLISQSATKSYIGLVPSRKRRPYRDVFICLQKAWENVEIAMRKENIEELIEVDTRKKLDNFVLVCEGRQYFMRQRRERKLL